MNRVAHPRPWRRLLAAGLLVALALAVAPPETNAHVWCPGNGGEGCLDHCDFDEWCCVDYCSGYSGDYRAICMDACFDNWQNCITWCMINCPFFPR